MEMRVFNLKLGEKYKLVRMTKHNPIIYYDVIGVAPLRIHCYSIDSDWECEVRETLLFDKRMELVSNDEFQRWIKFRNEL